MKKHAYTLIEMLFSMGLLSIVVLGIMQYTRDNARQVRIAKIRNVRTRIMAVVANSATSPLALKASARFRQMDYIAYPDDIKKIAQGNQILYNCMKKASACPDENWKGGDGYVPPKTPLAGTSSSAASTFSSDLLPVAFMLHYPDSKPGGYMHHVAGKYNKNGSPCRLLETEAYCPFRIYTTFYASCVNSADVIQRAKCTDEGAQLASLTVQYIVKVEIDDAPSSVNKEDERSEFALLSPISETKEVNLNKPVSANVSAPPAAPAPH